MKKLKLKFRRKNKSERKKRSKKNIILITIFGIGIILASIFLLFALYIIITSPDFEVDKLYTKESTVIYDRNNKEIARIGQKNVELITYDDLPQVLVDALIATEDSRFFQHNGFDAARFFKASLGQIAGNSGAGGASTLSMQITKNTFNGTESGGIKGIVRKFRDIYMAVFKLEAVYTKEEIIEFYLNSQWLSGGATNYVSINGVEQGSQYYFGKSVSDLTLAESSLLVGMFNNPVLYNPYKNPNNSSNRRSRVLELMVRHGYITEEDKEFAESIPVQSLLVDHSEDDSNEYQAFLDYVISEVYEDTGDDPRNIPMAIYTTLDSNIQDSIRDLETGKLVKFANDKVQFGLAITSVENGSILGLSGGRNYAALGLNRATARHQPGSTAKPIFDYGPYIEYISHSTGVWFIDEPWSYTTGGSIRNYDYRYIGPTTMRYALVDSRNIPAVQAYQQVAAKYGTNKIGEFVNSLGIDYGDTLYEANAIGGGAEISPLEESAAYGAFARGGYYIEPYAYTKVVYLETEETILNKYEKTRVMSEETAYMINNILTTAGQQGVGGPFSISGTDIAAKSGTTTIDSDAAKKIGVPTYTTPHHWLTTYSPDMVVSLWYGYDKLAPGDYLTSATGYSGKNAIMAAIGKKVYKKNARFSKPKTVVSATVELETYPTQLASEFTPANLKTTEYFASGYEPTETSTRFSMLDTPTNGNATFNGTTIKISWDAIKTPDAINQDYLEKFFNDNYGNYAKKYYDKRISYNSSNIGNIGYEVSVIDSSGETTLLGFTTDTNYTYNPTSTDDYTFNIKACYSIFKDNKSKALEIEAQAKIDSNIEDIITPEIDENENDAF